MDPGSQPSELANLTQVEEMLIALVSPILQVTHAIGGQYKHKGHKISTYIKVFHIRKRVTNNNCLEERSMWYKL